MQLERNDVRYGLWRKKVDGSLLRHSATPIPGWVVGNHIGISRQRWATGPESQVTLSFRGARFSDAVTWYRRGP